MTEFVAKRVHFIRKGEAIWEGPYGTARAQADGIKIEFLSTTGTAVSVEYTFATLGMLREAGLDVRAAVGRDAEDEDERRLHDD